ncbi:MAG: histidine--tRNA ligase [Planctomycetes bacterium]|nr:histidine--tRNA ligase [Planctomycetota bacterium]
MAKIAPVKGTRDFYPEQMAIRNWIIDGWRQAGVRNGFVEYDGPIFEHLQLFTQKSGDEIAGQLFSFTDRGGRDLALRPEMTPTLARMVNQQINSLARPIKWFTVPRLFRAERPQRGRLREFFQWNVDVIGSDLVLADAECIYTAVDFLRSVGLKSDDLVVRISSRAMLAELLKSVGFAENQLDSIYALLDKVPKVPSETFAAMTAEQIPDDKLREQLMLLQGIDTLDELKKFAPESAQVSIVQFESLFDHLRLMGVADYCQFDIKIVRGLAYYTGPVYEIFDRKEPLRAVCGGGRYDNLLSGLGGQHVPATGFGMGDVVLELMLKERGLVGRSEQKLDFFVIDAGEELYEKSLEVASMLREKGFSAVINYKRQAIGKQLKQAGLQNARWAVILGEETVKDGQVNLKDMAEGTQKTVGLEKFLTEPGIIDK